MSDLVKAIAEDLNKAVNASVRSRIRADVRERILAAPSSEIMTFVQEGGRNHPPEVSVQYATALWCFIREQPFEGSDLDSKITAPIVKAAEEAVVRELNSEPARLAIFEALAPGQHVNAEIRSSVLEDAAWLRAEVLSTVGAEPAQLAAEQIARAAAENASAVLQTAGAQTVIAALIKASMTTSGKLALAKLVSASSAKLASGTLMKLAVAAGLKKVGIYILVKTTIVKLLIILFPAVAAMKVPVFWVFLPILGAFVYHQLKNVPSKLAATLPETVANEVGRKLPEICHNYAEIVAADIVGEVLRGGSAHADNR